MSEFVEVQERTRTEVEVRTGLRGPMGPAGEKGEKGDPGAPGGSTHVHVQGGTSSSWLIQHDLGRHPSVTVVDSAGTVVIGTITYIDSNTVRVDFDYPFSGKAYFN